LCPRCIGAHEALGRVAGQAYVSRVDIALGLHRAPTGLVSVLLQVTDNGVRFPRNRTHPHTDEHHPLRPLDHRLRELGGSLTLTTGPGHGTTVRIQLPVEEA
jgi:signal transduction histidine kinase